MQQAKLTASGGVAGEVLGSAVAVSGDGSTIVAGAPGGASDPTDPGAVYVFTRPAGGWSDGTQTAKLTASGGAAGDQLGYSVAISSDGSTIVAGARHVNLKTGAAYVFVKPGSAWANTATANATLTVNGGNDGDNFGWSVAVSGDGSTVVAGAPDANTDAGAGYVFNSGATWGSEMQAATLTASGPTAPIPQPTRLVLGDLRGWVDDCSWRLRECVERIDRRPGRSVRLRKPMGAWTVRHRNGDADRVRWRRPRPPGHGGGTSSNGSTVIAGTESTVNRAPSTYSSSRPWAGRTRPRARS